MSGGGRLRDAVAVCFLLALVACGRPGSDAAAGTPAPPTPSVPSGTPSPSVPDRPEPRTNAEVVRVVDGDTVEAVFRGEVIDVRLIGIDTPETVHPSEPVGCFGPAASRYTERHLGGERVRLTFDVERHDRYGRTLAYVWLGRDLFNERIVREGFATVSTFPPNVRYVERFFAAQRSARQHDRGLWGRWDAGGEGNPPPEDRDEGGGGWDAASYPGVCIPPYPPDLDCAEVPYADFRVVGADPHGFDGDRDGIGCES